MTERHQKDPVAKNYHCGANYFEIADDSIQILLNSTQFITFRNQVKFRRICVESSEKNGTF